MLEGRGTRAEYYAYENDYARLLVATGQLRSLPDARYWRDLKGSHVHYVSIGGLLADPRGHDKTE